MKRSRGRGRRPANPANRTYESNGPDVKVRGNATTVYEKYQALARDALTSGDPVGAENYFQHAEHYFRILALTQPVKSEMADGETIPPVNGAREEDGQPTPQSDSQSTSKPASQSASARASDAKPASKPTSKPEMENGAAEEGAEGASAGKSGRRRGHLRTKPDADKAPPKTRASKDKASPQSF